MPLPMTDTRHLFRPLGADIVALLRDLPSDAWARPTLAGQWRVRDVVAHLLDTALRRLSCHRDAWKPPAPAHRVTGDQELVGFVRDLNAAWVDVAGRLSPRVLTDLYAVASADLAEFVERLHLEGPAHIPVSWAGEAGSAAWLDIGREFTEIWHHGAQVRAAVGAGPFSDARWLHAVFRIAMHALPRAYRDVRANAGRSVVIDISGEAGGIWSVLSHGGGWDVNEGGVVNPDATVTLSDEIAWRLLFNAVLPAEADAMIRVEGKSDLARPLLAARSVIV